MFMPFTPNYGGCITPITNYDWDFDTNSVPFWETKPACKSYWQIISQISARNKIDLKTAISQYRKLTGEPSKLRYSLLMKVPDDMLYSCNNKISIIKDEEKLISYGIQPYYAGDIDKIISIDIDVSSCNDYGIYYVLKDHSHLWFAPELLDVLK